MDILLHEIFAVITSSMVQCPRTYNLAVSVPHTLGNIVIRSSLGCFREAVAGSQTDPPKGYKPTRNPTDLANHNHDCRTSVW